MIIPIQKFEFVTFSCYRSDYRNSYHLTPDLANNNNAFVFIKTKLNFKSTVPFEVLEEFKFS